jgi:hypothetical protein
VSDERRWKMKSFADVREFLSSEGRLVNGLVLIGTLLVLVRGAWYVVSRSPSPGRLGLLVIGLCIALLLISGRFSAKLMRVVLLLSIGVVLLGLTHVGRDATEQRRLREGRATATALANRIDEVTSSLSPSGSFQSVARRRRQCGERTLPDGGGVTRPVPAPCGRPAQAPAPCVRLLRGLRDIAGDAE